MIEFDDFNNSDDRIPGVDGEDVEVPSPSAAKQFLHRYDNRRDCCDNRDHLIIVIIMIIVVTKSIWSNIGTIDGVKQRIYAMLNQNMF